MARVTEELLTAAEAASRLGVKPETLYAYVSRGLLTSARVPGERSSRYPAQEVERLAARATRAGRFARSTPPTVQTRLTLIADGRLSYRGRDAIELASTASYESVAAWLWTGRWRDNVTFPAASGQLDAVRTAAAGMPAQARLADRLRLIVAAAAANDPLRFDIRPEAVTATAANLIGTMVDALPLPDSTARRSPTSLAGRLWSRLTAAPPQPQAVEALNAALVLLADHDLAASTVAARVAASIRAHPYAVVSAGLAALDGPLHGAAPDETFRLISDALATDPLSAISERLRLGTAIPGFGHPLYPDGDPRATALLDHVRELPASRGVPAAVGGLVDAVDQRLGERPTIDFAVSALAHSTGMPADAGEAIFAVARTAGWVAHALEEYEAEPLRFRLRSSYIGVVSGGARDERSREGDH